MARKTDKLRHPLSAALARPSAVALLRVLCRADQSLNLRQLARAAGLNHQSCADILRELERLGMALREAEGRYVYYSLDPENALVSELIIPLFEREKTLVDEIQGSIRSRFADNCLKIVIDGAAAGIGSVSLITRKEGADHVRRAAQELAAGFEERYGLEIEFRVFTLDDAPLELL